MAVSVIVLDEYDAGFLRDQLAGGITDQGPTFLWVSWPKGCCGLGEITGVPSVQQKQFLCLQLRKSA